jgi:hypothetical protein
MRESKWGGASSLSLTRGSVSVFTSAGAAASRTWPEPPQKSPVVGAAAPEGSADRDRRHAPLAEQTVTPLSRKGTEG